MAFSLMAFSICTSNFLLFVSSLAACRAYSSTLGNCGNSDKNASIYSLLIPTKPVKNPLELNVKFPSSAQPIPSAKTFNS